MLSLGGGQASHFAIRNQAGIYFEQAHKDRQNEWLNYMQIQFKKYIIFFNQ